VPIPRLERRLALRGEVIVLIDADQAADRVPEHKLHDIAVDPEPAAT
jgi:hypothetical protein